MTRTRTTLIAAVIAMVSVLLPASTAATQGILTAAAPMGYFDSLTVTDSSVFIRGWAFDPGNVAIATSVRVSFNGADEGLFPTGTNRPDVNVVHHSGNNHGFAMAVPATGNVRVCLFAQSSDGGNESALGCKGGTPPVDRIPVFHYDGAYVLGNYVSVNGWMYDPDQPDVPLKIHVYVDGIGVGVGTADALRPDVDAAFGVGRNHGFSKRVALSPGTHNVCIYAINSNASGTNVLIGCRDFAPTPEREPLGHLDVVKLNTTTETVAVSGWSFDPDTPDRHVTIRVTIDGDVVSERPTATRRVDVDAAFGAGDNHGFSYNFSVSDQAHNICVYAINTNDSEATSLLGCRSTASQLGVLVTPAGVVTPIRAINGNTYVVTTPCQNEATVVGGTHIQQAMIVLDPGHGGAGESGAVGPNGLVERDLNLAVALEAKRLLEAAGITVVLTRQLDHYLPIITRAEIANALQPDLFVSIHHNGGLPPVSSSPGTEIFVPLDNADARRAGGIMYQEMVSTARQFPTTWHASYRAGVSARAGSDGSDFYGVHRRTPEIPSIITEFLWLSHSSEAALLSRVDVQNAEAAAIARAIQRWYSTDDVGSGFLSNFTDASGNGSGGVDRCVEPPLT